MANASHHLAQPLEKVIFIIASENKSLEGFLSTLYLAFIGG
ncbi:hypothetical protein CAter10_1816 [Collimonas arenae]|nr:hypothetical protein CAter10_1816 [Collimonas arenae]